MKTDLFRRLFLSAALLGVAVAVSAAEPSATVIEYGRYRSEITGFTPSTASSGGVLVKSTNTTHVETTTRIPCRIGESFGMIVELRDLPTDRDFKIQNVITHPPLPQPDGTKMTVDKQEKLHKAGEAKPGGVYRKRYLWHFVKGFEYELVPGKWTRIISVDGREVARMEFDVVKP